MVAAVAVTEGGEVIGHCALCGRAGDPLMKPARRWWPRLSRSRGPEQGYGSTDGRGPATRLGGLYAEAITLHPFSQRAIIKHGFRESAVLLSRFPRHIRVRGFTGRELPQRETVFYLYMPLRVEPCGVVFAPGHHRPLLERIYGNLGLKREFAPAEAAGQEAGTSGLPQEIPHFSLTAQAVSALDIGTIEVTNYGPGIEQEVKNKLRDLCHKEVATVYLYFPLGDPQTAVLCRRFEEFGFFFSGILPGRVNQPDKKGRLPGTCCVCNISTVRRLIRIGCRFTATLAGN